MSESSCFLQAILAEPDEVAHRLIYADWLEENGEGDHAELIRLGCNIQGLDQAGRGRLMDLAWTYMKQLPHPFRGTLNVSCGQEYGLECSLTRGGRYCKLHFRHGFIETATLPLSWLGPAIETLSGHPVRGLMLEDDMSALTTGLCPDRSACLPTVQAVNLRLCNLGFGRSHTIQIAVRRLCPNATIDLTNHWG